MNLDYRFWKECLVMKNKLIYQIISFGGVGILCFIIDFGILYVLTNVFGMYYLISAAVSFIISVTVNYILSVRYVFNISEDNSVFRNWLFFVIFSVIGLILTEIIMKIGVDIYSLNYMVTKVGATIIVMIYNFITRKLFLEN